MSVMSGPYHFTILVDHPPLVIILDQYTLHPIENVKTYAEIQPNKLFLRLRYEQQADSR